MSKSAQLRAKSHNKSAQRGAPIRFDEFFVDAAIGLRNAGFSLKFVSEKLGFHRNTITLHLREELDRLQPWAFKRQPERPSSVERQSVLLASLSGSHRLHAAHVVVDLWELMHHVLRTGMQPTLADFARVRGSWQGKRYEAQDEPSTVRAFYRIQSMLAAHGVRFEKRVVEGEPSIRLEFNVRDLSAFVKREIGFAGRLIEGYARRTGDKRRFRGR